MNCELWFTIRWFKFVSCPWILVNGASKAIFLGGTSWRVKFIMNGILNDLITVLANNSTPHLIHHNLESTLTARRLCGLSTCLGTLKIMHYYRMLHHQSYELTSLL